MRAEPAAIGLLRTSGDQQSVKPGSVQPIVRPTPEFATGPSRQTGKPHNQISIFWGKGQFAAGPIYESSWSDWSGITPLWTEPLFFARRQKHSTKRIRLTREHSTYPVLGSRTYIHSYPIAWISLDEYPG